MKYDIICLQETHIRREDKYLVYKSLGEEFVVADIKKNNGVVLYIHPQLKLVLVLNDGHGRFVEVEINSGMKLWCWESILQMRTKGCFINNSRISYWTFLMRAGV